MSKLLGIMIQREFSSRLVHRAWIRGPVDSPAYQMFEAATLLDIAPLRSPLSSSSRLPGWFSKQIAESNDNFCKSPSVIGFTCCGEVVIAADWISTGAWSAMTRHALHAGRERCGASRPWLLLLVRLVAAGISHHHQRRRHAVQWSLSRCRPCPEHGCPCLEGLGTSAALTVLLRECDYCLAIPLPHTEATFRLSK